MGLRPAIAPGEERVARMAIGGELRTGRAEGMGRIGCPGETGRRSVIGAVHVDRQAAGDVSSVTVTWLR